MKDKSLKITDFLSLAVFTVFAVCLLLVLLTGAVNALLQQFIPSSWAVVKGNFASSAR